jgi:hypothetical protein
VVGDFLRDRSRSATSDPSSLRTISDSAILTGIVAKRAKDEADRVKQTFLTAGSGSASADVSNAEDFGS